jgi:hypothetical protein
MADDTWDALKAEYFQLQKNYEDFDGRILQIKSWASLLTLGGVAAGLKEKSVGFLLVTICAAAYLWFLEARWKSFQYCYSARIEKLERYFRGEHPEEIRPLQIFTSWVHEWQYQRTREALRKIATEPFVMVPYAPIILLAALAIPYCFVP